MDAQQSSGQTSSQHSKVQVVAQQLLKAINESPSHTDSNIIIFLTKLYKNNSSIKNKKMKSIRLNRFIHLLQCLLTDFPLVENDVQLLYHCVVSTLMNDKNFYDEEDYELVYAMGVEIGKIIEKLCEGDFSSLANKILGHLINNESLSLTMEMSQFEQKLKQSVYYQSINLDSTSVPLSQCEPQVHILQQPAISNVILANISVEKAYSRLFKTQQNKSSVVSLFEKHLQKLSSPIDKSRKQLFIDSFITPNQHLTVAQAESLLHTLQSKAFDRQTINSVVDQVTQKLSLEQLFQIDFKKIKGIEEVFVQRLLQSTSKQNIQQVVDLFLNMNSDNNYFPLYLVLKLNKKIPLQYVSLFFEDNALFNVRKAIVFALAIIDNEHHAFDALVKSFIAWNSVDRVRTKKNYQTILKSIHFSLQNITKATTISQILRSIHKQNLNHESTLEFINYNSLKVSTHQETKHLLTEQNRHGLSILFKTLTEFDKMTKGKLTNTDLNPQEIKELELEHKCRLDLEFLLNSNPFVEQQIMSSVKELNKLLNGSIPVDELIKQLPSLKESLWEVVLMWINNKYDTFFTEEVNQQSLDWALKTYKKISSDLNSELRGLLQKQKLEKYFKLIKTLIEYGIEDESELKINTENTKILTPQIKQLINSSNCRKQRMDSTNFNDYFLTQSSWKNYISWQEKSIDKVYKKIIWLKSLLIEVKELIKNMTKGEKTAGKKELKNIVAQNVGDVLAFKVIHEYFESEIEHEGKQTLVEIFRNIQPDMEFFERAEALASALSIEFYSIFQELPNLLQNFNSETLIFLSKLLSNPKPQEQKKKIKAAKKKNQKEAMVPEENLCINAIIKNFGLLFSDPNSSESYKSLFMILRKLVEQEKADKEELEVHMNKWLSEVSFISCAGFEPWKNKVLALAKMWKNAAELMGDKKVERRFSIKVLEKHFNLFTDLLNKLYETFREQGQFLELQQRILLSLCLIYKKQDFSSEIQPENDMTDYIIKKFQQRNILRMVLDNKYYYCHECKKQACYACTSFLHRNHDKIYMGKGGNCEHENPKTKKDSLLKPDSNSFLRPENNSSLFSRGNLAELLKKNEDLPEELLERISQKILLEEQLKASEQHDQLGRYHSPNIQQILEGRIPKNKIQRNEEIKRKLRQQYSQLRQKQSQLRSQIHRQQREEVVVEDEKSFSPQPEGYFQYKQPHCKQFKKIHSELTPTLPQLHIPHSKINVSPLAKVFLRELQNQHFHHQQNALPLQTLANHQQASQIKDKYLFFKNNNLKGDNRDSRDHPFGRGRGGYAGFAYGSNPRSDVVARRGILACNKKHLFMPSGLSMLNFSMSKLKEKLDKKITASEFNTQEQQKNYVATPPLNLPFDVAQTSLSQSSTSPTLAVISQNQLCFYTINADGRFGRQINTEFHRMDNIVKFTWINDKKNLFAIAYQNYIRVGGVSPSNNIKTFAKAQIGKTIRDFDGYMNSKMYMLLIIDTEGKLYFIEVDFKEGKNAAYSSADRMITLVDQNNKPLPSDIYSVKNIDGNRILVSCENGTVRTVDINRDTNLWKASTFDLKKAINSDLPLVLETVKLVKHHDDATYVAALCRKFKPFENKSQRKHQGSLLLLKLQQNLAASSALFTREDNIESYDFTFPTSNTIDFVFANEEGQISMFRHSIDPEPTQIVQKINPSMDNSSIKTFCKKLVASNVFHRIEDGAMLKNLEFKENKQLTANFTLNLKEKEQISVKQLYPTCNHFLSGISFEVELPSSVSEYTGEDSPKEQDCIAVIKLKCLDSSYKFYCNSKKREIQIPFNIKQTMELFAHENELKMSYSVVINEQILEKEKLSAKEMEEFIKVKSVQIHGFEARDLASASQTSESSSVYHKAFRELFYDWHTYQEYAKEGFEEYLLNIYRMDFNKVDMKRLYRLKFDNSSQGPAFKMHEINLFLKLELFAQTVAQSLGNDKLTTKKDLEGYLDCIKNELLIKEYKRKSLENSVFRLCQAVCHVYQSKTPVTVGHPYHRQTLMNLHQFVTLYKKWLQKKNIFSFDQLCTLLSNLILSQALDLHLILQACPDLIIELSLHFKKLLTDKKHKNSEEDNEVSLTRICSKFISILCEYYQMTKNRMVERAEEKLLHLLEQIFAQGKSEMPKELMMNPFLYLESILNLNEFTTVTTAIELYPTEPVPDFSDAFFDLEKSQKTNKKTIKQLSEPFKEEEQQLLNENSNYEAIIEEEKDMDEEEKEMYMQIEDDFDDEDDEINLDDPDAMDLEIPKPNTSSNNQQNDLHDNSELSSLQQTLQATITKTLLAQTLPNSKKTTITHHDFPLELAIALFRKQNYLTSTNVYFYLGLLYNLLKIVENNLKIKQNKGKMMEFVQIVDKKIDNIEYSCLFIVLNFFVGPIYAKGISGIVLKKPESNLSEYFSTFYLKNQNRFAHLLTSYHPTVYSPMGKLSEIMKFSPFEMKNELYNLKLLSNIYLSFRLLGNNFTKPEEKSRIKQKLLFRLVEYRVPALKNIMLFEKWQKEVERAKILVSYQILRDDKKKFWQKEEGMNMLYKCGKETPEHLVEELVKDETKVTFLQEFSLLSEEMTQSTQKKVFELLEIYYNS